MAEEIHFLLFFIRLDLISLALTFIRTWPDINEKISSFAFSSVNGTKTNWINSVPTSEDPIRQCEGVGGVCIRHPQKQVSRKTAFSRNVTSLCQRRQGRIRLLVDPHCLRIGPEGRTMIYLWKANCIRVHISFAWMNLFCSFPFSVDRSERLFRSEWLAAAEAATPRELPDPKSDYSVCRRALIHFVKTAVKTGTKRPLVRFRILHSPSLSFFDTILNSSVFTLLKNISTFSINWFSILFP